MTSLHWEGDEALVLFLIWHLLNDEPGHRIVACREREGEGERERRERGRERERRERGRERGGGVGGREVMISLVGPLGGWLGPLTSEDVGFL